jgi:hypothetical protein
MSRRRAKLLHAGLWLTLVAAPVPAQVHSGRIDVSVADDDRGAPLAGVALAAIGADSATAVTDRRGEAHFVNLAPGTYTVTATKAGFNEHRTRDLVVTADTALPLPIWMSVAGSARQTDIRVDARVIDVRAHAASTPILLPELQRVPWTRDPWSVLERVPAVIADHVNIGWADSGQQPVVQAKDADPSDNTWNLDGVTVTDMSAPATSSTELDFDMLQEMRVTTGGADPRIATPGAQVSLVMPSGTREWRGSARAYFGNHALQASNGTASLRNQLNSYSRAGDYKDFGAEGGGPLVRRRLLAWAAAGRSQPERRIFTRTGGGFVQTARDATTVESYAVKGTAVWTPRTRLVSTYVHDRKREFGRDASGVRPDETAVDERGSAAFFKGEINQTIRGSLFLAARYAHTSSDFTLEPRGGRAARAWRDDQGINHGSWSFYSTDRPQNAVALDAHRFWRAHQFTFGVGWRNASDVSRSGWPGGGRTLHRGYPTMTFVATRETALAGKGVYWSGYLGDTFVSDRFALNAAVRWDRSAGSIRPSSVAANPLVPGLLPALNAHEQTDAVVWNSLTPRVGVTYLLTEQQPTVIRASYAMFASQLPATLAASTASQIPDDAAVVFRGIDRNGNNVAESDEVTSVQGFSGFDPSDPARGNPDSFGGYKTPLTHELIVGGDRELSNGIGLTALLTWRRTARSNWLHYRGVTGSDYVLASRVTGTVPPVGTFDVPVYRVNDAAIPSDHGRVYEARDGYYQRYWGLEIAASKRLSNNWMMRLGFTTSDHREYFDGLDALQDPTPTVDAPNSNGGAVIRSTESHGRTGVFMLAPRYQFAGNMAYETKLGIDVGLNYLYRQGYSLPYFVTSTDPADALAPAGRRVLLVGDVGRSRLPNVHTLDARISKPFSSTGLHVVSVHLDFDVFNVFNRAMVLERGYDLALGNFNRVLAILNPRVVRLGARVSF